MCLFQRITEQRSQSDLLEVKVQQLKQSMDETSDAAAKDPPGRALPQDWPVELLQGPEAERVTEVFVEEMLLEMGSRLADHQTACLEEATNMNRSWWDDVGRCLDEAEALAPQVGLPRYSRDGTPAGSPAY